MSASETLNQITIPSPCQSDWHSMRGDDRARFCEACGRSVVNLSALTEDEAASVVARAGDDLCAQVTRRKDGSVVTVKGGRGRWTIRRLMGWIAMIAAWLGFLRFFVMTSVVTVGRVCRPPTPALAPPTPPTSPNPGPPSKPVHERIAMP